MNVMHMPLVIYFFMGRNIKKVFSSSFWGDFRLPFFFINVSILD